jgi:hypothetical protein
VSYKVLSASLNPKGVSMNASQGLLHSQSYFRALFLSALLFLVPQQQKAHSQVTEVRTNYYALVLYYNPKVWKDGQLRSYRETYGSRDIDVLCAEYIKFLKRASGGQVQFQVAFRFEVEEFPPDNDPDVTFTSENYHQLISSHYDMWSHGMANYAAICEDPRFGIVQKVESGQVDAIWIFPPNNTGFWETAMAGHGAYWVNGGAYTEVDCSRKFVLYGFGTDPHQGVGFMLENTGHMAEVIMRNRIAYAWPKRNLVSGWNTMDLTNPWRIAETWGLTDWDFFTCTDGMHWDTRLVVPGRSQAGLSHFPPTACFNYGWDDLRITFLPWEAENIRYLDGTWSPGDRVLTVSNTGPVIAKAMLNGSHDETDTRGRYRVPVALTDFDVQAGITVLTTNDIAHAGITFRFNRYDDGAGGQDGYYAALHPGRDKVQLYRLGPFTGHTLVTEADCVLEPNTNYNICLSVRGSNVTVRLDPIDPPALAWSDIQIDFGGIGMGAGGGSASFTHFNLTPVLPNYAESWRDYPLPQGPPRRLTSAEWAGDNNPHNEMDNFYAWWYEHIPKSPGTHLVTDTQYGGFLGVILNSWWPYIFDINTFDTPFLPPGMVIQSPEPDVTPPAPPFGLAGVGVGPREILLEWNEPADNIGVTRYHVYRDAELVARVATRSFTDRYLAPGSTHDYRIVALDGSANASAPSLSARVSTGNPAEALRNGGFEQGLSSPTVWAHRAFSPEAIFRWEPAPAGCYRSRCVSISSSVPNHALWLQEISGLVPSGRYLLTAFIKGDNVVLEPGGYSAASIGSLDRWESQGWLLAGTFDWTPVGAFLTADEAGRIQVVCRLGHHSSLASGSVWFDDLRLEYAPALQKAFFFSGNNLHGVGLPPNSLSECTAIVAGDAHVLALKLNGEVLTWGDNSKGQLTPPWPSGTQLRSIAAGANHCLALRRNQELVAWGDNSSGQLYPPAPITNAVAIAAGGDFSMALKADGRVIAWGSNDQGQTGIAPDLPRVLGISAGRHFAVALTSDSGLRAWGRYATDTGVYAPAYVPAGVSNVISVACGAHHVLALLADGTVRAWGRNAEGQTNVPEGLRKVVQVAAGNSHSLALTEDGTLAGWGSVPAPGEATNVFAMAAGNGFTVALTQGRLPRGWARAERVACADRTFEVDAAVPAGSAGFLLQKFELQSGDWTVASGDISLPGLLHLNVPATGPTAFFKIATRPW